MKKYALTSEQLRLYIEWKLDPKSTAYNMTNLKFEIAGDFDVARLDRALFLLKRHYESMRTYFSEEDGVPYQYILSKEEIDLDAKSLDYVDFTDIPGCSGKSLKEHAYKLSDAIMKEASDLSVYPLIKGHLIKYAPDKYLFIIVVPHIVKDGSCHHEFLLAISEFYNNPEVAIKRRNNKENQKSMEDYLDYIKSSSVVERNKIDSEYWIDILKGVDSFVMPMRAIYSEKVAGKAIRKMMPLLLSPELSKGIRKIASDEKTTVFVVIATMVAVLLKRCFSEKEMVLGYAVNIRPKEFRDIMGFFVNTLPLRIDFTENISFYEILRQVSKRRLEDRQHQNYPLTNIIFDQKKENSCFDRQSFNFIVDQAHVYPESLDLDGIEVEPLGFCFAETEIQEDMTFIYENRGNEPIKFLFVYNSSIFDEVFISGMKDNFQVLLEGIVKNPSSNIEQLPLLTPLEMEQILVNWNSTEVPYPRNMTLHKLFEEQAGKTPNNIAVVFKDKKLTYKELNEKANQLARYIRRSYKEITNKDISGDVLIGVCVEKSLEMIIGILGILKAGCAYVPVDYSFPDDRIMYILDDIKVKFVLTNNNLGIRLNTIIGNFFDNQGKARPKNIFNILNIEDKQLQNKILLEPICNICLTNNSAINLAYVLYTSGSTGKPKGVMIEHRGAVSLIKGVKYIDVSSSDSFMQVSNLSFDTSMFEIWAALLNGAKLFVPYNKNELILDADLFLHELKENNITTLWLTTPIFDRLFLTREDIFSDLKYLLIGGDALNKILITRLLYSDKSPQNVLNGYGPTENSTFSCVLNIKKEHVDKYNSVPIGVPLTNRKVYVLDKNLTSLPIGVIGELYVGGEGLARGYLNNPELTREKFIDNPFVTDEDKIQGRNLRLYKTGDLCRWLFDGNLEFIERADNQIKIRGFRIELGEIEAVIQSIEGVNQCVVLTRDNADHQKRLVAYITLDKDVLGLKMQEEMIRKCREECRTKLPDYMQPSQIMVLENFPLTSNGKINREILPIPEGREGSDEYKEPEGLLEEQLAGIWRDMLKINKIGRNDNFFELGGNSLIAMQIITQMRKVLNVDLPMVVMFERHTICELAQFIKNVIFSVPEEGKDTGYTEGII